MQSSLFLKKALVTLASIFYSFCATFTWADDTDIYLHNPNLDDSIKPNVLFILDNSGSMRYTVGKDEEPEGREQSRMEIMQGAFRDIIDNASGLNVGLMKLNVREGENSRLTFPVTDIDKPLNINYLDKFPEIASSHDDAHEDDTGQVTLLSPDLILGGSHLTALRFQAVGIPQGARVTSATITFTASASSIDDGTQPEITIRTGKPIPGDHHQVINPSFDENSNKPSTRAQFGTATTWTPQAWVKGEEEFPSQYSVDVTSLLQELVSDPAWCGNESASFYFQSASANEAFRQAYSVDGSASLKPQLTLEYTGGANGCKNEFLDIRIKNSANDAYETAAYTIENQDNFLRLRNDSYKTFGGMHYPGLPIRKGAKILAAHLQLTAYRNDNSTSKIQIYAHNNVNSSPIKPREHDLSYRAKTTSVYWDLPAWKQNITYQTPDISPTIQQVVNMSDWQPGNNLTLLLSAQSGYREAISYDNNPTLSPRLTIKVESGGIDTDSIYKVKDHLVALVNQMKPDGWTPLTPTYYDATMHFKKDGSNDPSPINNICQSNYIVMLSDGEAKDGDKAPTAISNINRLPSISNCETDSGYKHEKCARTLADWLNTYDLNPTINDLQNVTTHTIAFALQGNNTATRFLTDIAREGGGNMYTADNAADLANAFNNIITGIIEDESTFVSPGVTANQFNNSRHLSHVYYSVFKPSKTDRWQGNLKRYRLTGNPLDVYDASSPPEIAVDGNTGFFKESAFSFWSDSVDGRKVNVGGAGDNIPADQSRKLFTYLGSNPKGQAVNLNSYSHHLHKDNQNITPQALGLPPSDNTRRSELLTWIRNPATWYGDPLHSVPALATYGCSVQARNCPEQNQRLGIFFGTNDGFVHGIDANTGAERFAFMPAELLPNLDKLKTNAATDRVNNGRPYGMDGSVTLWVNDLNNNGVIYGGYDILDFDPASDYLPAGTVNKVRMMVNDNEVTKEEFVYAYIGMRRGGQSYYALDVTAADSPKLLWFITAGDPGFEKLGQTWAKPVKTRIKIGSNIRDVLIFSGGYDPAQDKAITYQNDNMGNAVYIVDAHTGAMIWSTSNDSNANLTLSRMNYSIPGGVRVIDLQGDGLADQMFFADTGGQVWRLFINNGVTSINDLVWPSDSDGDGLWTRDEGVFADLGPTASQVNANDGGLAQRPHARRFYVEPDISLFRLNGSTHLALAIGSGNRPDPLGRINSVVRDRAYAMASPYYGNPLVTDQSVSSRNVPEHSVLKHNSGNTQLQDITQIDSSHKDIEPEDFFGTSASDPRKGWFITLDPGEKVMTESVTFEQVVYFNTYLPSSETSLTCNPVAGSARAYAVDLLTSLPVKDEDGVLESTDRYTNLANTGLPPTTSILFPEGSKDALICVGAECNPLEIGDDKQTTYWRQVR